MCRKLVCYHTVHKELLVMKAAVSNLLASPGDTSEESSTGESSEATLEAPLGHGKGS